MKSSERESLVSSRKVLYERTDRKIGRVHKGPGGGKWSVTPALTEKRPLSGRENTGHPDYRRHVRRTVVSHHNQTQ